MKPILFALALVVAITASAKVQVISDTAVTPLGLRIRPEMVLANGLDGDCMTAGLSCCSFEFLHGNITVRMIVDNPTATEQMLMTEFRFRTGSRGFGGQRFTRYLSTRAIPPGPGNVVDFTIPHTGYLSQRYTRDEANVLFTDASGKTVGIKDVDAAVFPSRFDCFRMPSDEAFEPGPSERTYDGFVVATSGSFVHGNDWNTRISDWNAQFPKDADPPVMGYRSSLGVACPDFSRIRDWRDLACFDVVIFTESDWSAATDDVREIVKDYQAAGGVFVLADSSDKLDMKWLYTAMCTANRYLRGYGNGSVFACDRDAIAEVERLKHELPFGGIVLTLLLFSIVAGPVAILVLAKRGKRIHILWIFPSVSIVFSLAVALVVVFKNGLDVKVVKFGEEMDRSEFGRKLVVRDTVYVAPFPMKDPIVSSRTALVTVDSGGEYTSGECVVLTPDSLELRGNWTPCLWPVRVRELEVVRTGKEASK